MNVSYNRGAATQEWHLFDLRSYSRGAIYWNEGGGIQKDRIKYIFIIIKIAFRIWYALKITCAKVQKFLNFKWLTFFYFTKERPQTILLLSWWAKIKILYVFSSSKYCVNIRRFGVYMPIEVCKRLLLLSSIT